MCSMTDSKEDAKRVETLIELNSLINSDYSDVNTLLTRIVESAMLLCDGEAASLLLLNQSDKKLYFEVALGSKGSAVQKFTLNLGEGIAGWVAKNNKSLIANDVEKDARFFSDISKSVGFKTNSILAVPMRLKDTCAGVIELINKKNGRMFTEYDLQWLEIFANQAALALSNARLYGKTQNEIAFLQDSLQLSKGFHEIVYESQEMHSIMQVVQRVGATNATVLILGESGVGKELIAEQIHLNSRYRSKPFVRVNCAALPEGLLESELFGHVKGAFTDAVKDRVGKFEQADDGTIFLDEIGELSLQVQAKLLRVLEDGTFEPLGSNVQKTVRARILSATNKNLSELVQEGLFRKDLYYRLNVIPITVPALRNRITDIPILAKHFLQLAARETNKQVDSFDQSALESLKQFNWPGNVRELKNVVERAVVITQSTSISKDHLLLGKSSIEKNDEFQGKTLKDSVNLFKKYFIISCLERHNWNQTSASRELEIQRTYLSRLMKELDISH